MDTTELEETLGGDCSQTCKSCQTTCKTCNQGNKKGAEIDVPIGM